MQHPEYIYWALVMVIAWPCSLFSRCSGILAATWAIGQVAYGLGAPEPEFQTGLYPIACFVTALEAFFISRSWRSWFVAFLYVPLAIMSALWAANVNPHDMWWGIFWVGCAQVLFIPATVEWQQIRDTISAFRERKSWQDTFYYLRSLSWSLS